MKSISMMIYLVLTFALPIAYAKSKCSNTEIMKLDERVGGAGKSISSLHKVFKDIDKCKALDGGIADGFYDAASNLLAKNFNEVLASPSLQDKAFKNALLGSISDGTEVNTFGQICASAKVCAGKKVFCDEASDACKRANEAAKRIKESK